MINKTDKTLKLKGTKAEVLESLSNKSFNIPKVYYFNVREWRNDPKIIIDKIIKLFSNKIVAVRSSALAEDTEESSMAGAFKSFLNIEVEEKTLIRYINKVISSFDSNMLNQVLIQPMVSNVAMSGVIMSKVLDDGSPYYVINYDDQTGLTDTVTSGSAINKTVYIYNGVNKKDFDSPYLISALNLVRNLEKIFPKIPLDIEFIIDNDIKSFLLQVRRITTKDKWKQDVNSQVSQRMIFLKQYVEKIMNPRSQLFGEKTLLGFMPDWNPAEMIGVVPHPLSMSLYRVLITKSTWMIAREKMGYRKLPNVELMISLFGRAYIDVRNSINSFLPSGINEAIGNKVVNACIERLDKYPQLHDKIEFKVVHTAYDFDFNSEFNRRYPDLLSKKEISLYKKELKKITIQAIEGSGEGSLNGALKDINTLKILQSKNNFNEINKNVFSLSDRINTLINDCIEFGTLPFSIIARHAFIAEGLLRSAVKKGAISSERMKIFKSSIVTVAGKMSHDFIEVLNKNKSKEDYLAKYGHLRPNSYDILSPNYNNRKELFDGVPKSESKSHTPFVLSKKEIQGFNKLLIKHEMNGINVNDLFLYFEEAIKGREYAKFVFTKTLSEILETVAEWGLIQGFSREQMSMLTIDEILSVLYAPLRNESIKFFENRIDKAKNNFEVASSFKLSYLIRSGRDIYIVPMQRSSPNFIGNGRLESEVVELTPYQDNIPNLRGKIICIEGADPGYDWIFTRNIKGLVTKYGGANSHMAIRSAEYGILAAIGCGEQTYQRIINSKNCILDCTGKRLEPLELNGI